MEGWGKEKGGWEEGRKKKHPTPHTALNNEGLLGVWAVCGPGERVVYAGKLLCLQEFYRLLMAGVFPLSQASVRAPHTSMKTFVIPIKYETNQCSWRGLRLWTPLQHPSYGLTSQTVPPSSAGWQRKITRQSAVWTEEAGWDKKKKKS